MICCAVPVPTLGEDAGENLLCVRVQEDEGLKYGYVDFAGNIVIEPKWRRAFAFCEGLAPVLGEEGCWGYINTSGNPVEDPPYLGYVFPEGLALDEADGNMDLLIWTAALS